MEVGVLELSELAGRTRALRCEGRFALESRKPRRRGDCRSWPWPFVRIVRVGVVRCARGGRRGFVVPGSLKMLVRADWTTTAEVVYWS